jgi:hypothetical protein
MQLAPFKKTQPMNAEPKTRQPRTSLTGGFKLACASTTLLPLLFVSLTFSLTHKVAAQNTETSTQSTQPSHKPVHKKKPTKAELKAEAEKKAFLAPIDAPVDPGPTWPVDDVAKKPEISWDSNGLKIEATNSSLKDIIQEITTDTGVTIEGLNNDQRIFGVYGPGRARDVLGQLLEGTGYNVLMIGEQGPGTPRQVVLSVRGTAVKTETPSTSQRPIQMPDEDDADTPDDPNPQPVRPGFRGPGGRPQLPQPADQQTPQQNQPNQPNQQQTTPQPNGQPAPPPS